MPTADDVMKDSRPLATQPAAPPRTTQPWPDVDDLPPSAAVYLSAPAGWYATLKPTFELIAAAVLVVLLFPFMVAAWLAIKLTSPGPGVYAQTRSGRGGRLFRIFK